MSAFFLLILILMKMATTKKTVLILWTRTKEDEMQHLFVCCRRVCVVSLALLIMRMFSRMTKNVPVSVFSILFKEIANQSSSLSKSLADDQLN